MVNDIPNNVAPIKRSIQVIPTDFQLLSVEIAQMIAAMIITTAINNIV